LPGEPARGEPVESRPVAIVKPSAFRRFWRARTSGPREPMVKVRLKACPVTGSTDRIVDFGCNGELVEGEVVALVWNKPLSLAVLFRATRVSRLAVPKLPLVVGPKPPLGAPKQTIFLSH